MDDLATPTPHAARSLELPSRFPSGFEAACTRVGMRHGPGDDLALLVAPPGTTAAGVFTRNRFAAAPIDLSRRHLAATAGSGRALLINAGCANAATGPRGVEDANRCVSAVAAMLDVPPEAVLVNSTGVIGEHLPIEGLLEAIATLEADLHQDAVDSFARAIMTTDSAPKAVRRTVPAADGGEVVIVGIAKGSGMIHPNMATMIGAITTDATVTPVDLDAVLRRSCDSTFNRVSVDGDTSTNDAVFALASAAAGPPADPDAFEAAIHETCLELARMIVADGEGASRVLEVVVHGAATAADAREVAQTIGSSLLVRTAVAGGDPNWGRIVAALGRTEAAFDPNRVRITANGVLLFEAGRPQGGDSEDCFSAETVVLGVELGSGGHSDRHLTCDLTESYVRINADYRT